MKLVVVKISREGIDEVGNPIYGITSRVVLGFLPPKELKGPPSDKKYSPEEILDSIVQEDLRFEKIKEDWNVYKLKDGAILKIKVIPTMVNKTKLFDNKGEPIYQVQHQLVMKGHIPKELRKKLLRLAKSITKTSET